MAGDKRAALLRDYDAIAQYTRARLMGLYEQRREGSPLPPFSEILAECSDEPVTLLMNQEQREAAVLHVIFARGGRDVLRGYAQMILEQLPLSPEVYRLRQQSGR